ncbi:hypothetical protein TUM4438_10270 [Shewanella sairae]|uniref:Uncharacterized protein n=2 Tax=Shewanella sairae TaxID=190310 RepID=A0ABQ4P6R7_9GAMM|nr:hypothetical protein TUM4438_10270 [Shewanella sairae]
MIAFLRRWHSEIEKDRQRRMALEEETECLEVESDEVDLWTKSCEQARKWSEQESLENEELYHAGDPGSDTLY